MKTNKPPNITIKRLKLNVRQNRINTSLSLLFMIIIHRSSTNHLLPDISVNRVCSKEEISRQLIRTSNCNRSFVEISYESECASFEL